MDKSELIELTIITVVVIATYMSGLAILALVS